jgi:hypothetical protein
MIASDIAVDRGATAEPNKPPKKRPLSQEEQAIVATWETFGAPRVE